MQMQGNTCPMVDFQVMWCCAKSAQEAMHVLRKQT
jgi:hypothetical protein